jgi:hypothetical protein
MLPILPPKIHLVALTRSLLLRLLIIAIMSAVIDLVKNKSYISVDPFNLQKENGPALKCPATTVTYVSIR